MAVAVWTAAPDGSLTLAGHAGFSAGGGRTLALRAARAWRPSPAWRSVERRTGHWSPTSPRRASRPSGTSSTPDGGRVAVPAGTGGRIHGVLEIGWPHRLAPQLAPDRSARSRPWPSCAPTPWRRRSGATRGPRARGACPDVAELIDLADGLHDPALVLTPHLDARRPARRLPHPPRQQPLRSIPAGGPRGVVNGALLLEAYPMAAGESELFEQIERVYATGEPFRAAAHDLTALVDQVPLTSVADISISRHGDSVLLIWRIEDETARLASLLQHAQRLGRIGGFEENLLTGEITWNSQLFACTGVPPPSRPCRWRTCAAHAHPDDAVAIGRFLRTVLHHRRPASAAFRLRRPDGVTRHIRVVAEPVLDADDRLFAVRGAYQDISAQHWTEVALAATRDQLAHTEQQSAERNRLTLQLQHAIMPPTQDPLEAPGLDVAVRYRPAETEHLVGGDWYDAVVLPSRQILLCVGDVAGHGIEAATGMVVLRNALRGLAVTGAGPGQLLSWLNIVAHHLAEQRHGHRGLRPLRPGDPHPAVGQGRSPAARPGPGEGAASLPLLEGLLLGALARGRRTRRARSNSTRPTRC